MSSLLVGSGLPAFFGMPGYMELMIVGVIVLLLFGNRLPSVMRSLGSSVTEFKKGVNEADAEEAEARREAERKVETKSDRL